MQVHDVSARLPALALLVLLSLAGYFMLADYLNYRTVSADPNSESLPDMVVPQPWGGYAWRDLTRRHAASWRLHPAESFEYLLQSSRRYPLDAFQWLDLAEIFLDQEGAGSVDPLLNAASAASPFNRLALWSATQLALQSGDTNLAERQIRKWVADYPRDAERALFVGRRWIESPAELIDRVLPPEREFIEQVLQIARQRQDLELAEAAWTRLEPAPDFGDRAFLEYMETLMNAGRVELAAERWSALDPSSSRGGIFNGSFDRTLGEPFGFNWRIGRLPGGVQIDRDTETFSTAPASLRIRFGGKDNVRLASPMVRMPVTPGERLRLSGVWRAESITTRARPYLWVNAEGTRSNFVLPVPGSDFGWSEFEIEIDVPQDVHLLQLVVRRDPTNDFDRYIGGSLWIDDLQLTQRPEANELEAVEEG